MSKILAVLLLEVFILLLSIPFTRRRDRGLLRARAQQKATRSFLKTLKIHVIFDTDRVTSSPGLIVSNHLGVLDPIILAAKLPVCFAAKAEMARWFLIGFVCRLVGTIFVNRDRKLATTQFVADIKNRIDSGVSVLVFPEGTTSTGETLRSFKTGAFEAIAYLSENEVIPVYIQIVDVNGDSSSAARQRLTWANPNQSLLQNMWDILGITSATILISHGNPVQVGTMNRKELAQRAYDEVNLLKTRIEATSNTASENLVT